jgi:glycosyltransferase involved in cell wall biosynthesis
MRVLYVNQTAQMSGAERSLLALLKGLEGKVERQAACPEGELAEELRAVGVAQRTIVGTQASFRLHPVHTGRGLVEIGRSAVQVRRLVAAAGPDLVHANTTRASLLALLARDRSGPPVIAHIRDWVPEGRFSRFVLGVIARRADALLANSAYIARQFDGLETRRPVRVLHNPVDLERFDRGAADGAAVRRELGLSDDDVVLSVVAQLTPWKGQDDAIRALAALRGEGRRAVLLLAGSAKFSGAGTQYDNQAFEHRLHRLAAELDVDDGVHFLGERSDVPDVLAATDILVMPSWREAFGRVAVEAMAMGVPVVATDSGGPAEIVRPGLEGLLVPPRLPDAWTEGLGRLVASRETRAEMGGRALERARDFSIEIHVDEILDLYAELAGPPAG